MSHVQKTIVGIFIGLAFAVTIFSSGYGIGKRAEQLSARQAAIEAGVAAWRVNEKTGDLFFEYLKADCPTVYEKKAIEAGAAYYSVNKDTGIVSFNFIGPDLPPTALVIEPTQEILPPPEKAKPQKEGLSINLK